MGAPAGMSTFDRACQISPRTRTRPSGRQSSIARPTLPASVSGPTLGGARWDHHIEKAVSVTSTATAATITGTVQASGTTKTAIATPTRMITRPLLAW